MPQWAALSWHSDMQLAGKLVLSAAALLLLTLAYRFYRSRSLAAGKIPLDDEGEPRENASRDGDEDGNGEGAGGVRRRRVLSGEVRRDGGDAAGDVPGTRHLPLRRARGVPRGEEEEEEGERVVSELGLTGKGARLGPAGRESELGSKVGCRLGSESESSPGAEPENDPGDEPGSKLGNELRNEVGSKLGSESGNKLGIKPGNHPGSEMRSKSGNETRSELASEPGVKFGSEVGSKSGSKSGTEQGSDLGREPGIKLESKLGNESGSELGSEPGSELGSEQGSKLGRKLGSKLGIKMESDLRSKSESELGSKLGNKLGNELGNETGRKLGSELGSELGSDLGSHDAGNVTKTLSSHEGKGTLAPDTGLSPGSCNAQMAGDGHAQSTEKGLAAGGTSRKTKGNRESIQTLSVTSNLGFMMTVSDPGTDTSYSFSSVAKIRVEENYIPERRGKDREHQASPGLKGKVYDYYVQSTSESVLKKKCLPYVPPGTPRSERGNEEQGPDLAARDPTTSSSAPPPVRSSGTSPEPRPPGRKSSILQIAYSPHLQLPLDGFGVTAPGGTPPASPGAGPVADPDLFQMPPPTHLDLGNCFEVLSSAKAQNLRPLQDAAYKVMSDNFLQVLRTPSIYGRLNAGERELILRRRMKGRTHLVVADVKVQEEPGPHRSRLCYYDEGGDSWHPLCHVPPEVVSRGCSTCSMFNYLFVVAGCEGTGRAQRPSRRVFCYDPLTNAWRELCPLNQARPRCKLVALDGHLYAIGGECQYTVERYDPRRDRWAFVAPLPRDTFAVAHAAAVCDGEIYVTGGTLRCLLLCYHPGLDSWRASPAVGGKDRTAEMVSVGGFVYRLDLRRGAGVSVHRCAARAGLWYQCATHALRDPPGFQCAVLGSLVHCVGRQFHVRFLADHISPRFGAKELRPFPAPHGSLLPSVLVLPEGGMAQTQV